MLGEHGFPGFFLWIGLFMSYNFSLWRLRTISKACEELQGFIPYVEMLQVSLWGFMVVGSFFDAPYFDLFYYMIAALIILKEKIAEALGKLPAVVSLPSSNSPLLRLHPTRLVNS
jgi:putative inorganic carbon (HCO3(-)) transporter